MSNWQDFLDDDRKPVTKKKINKHLFCKKNKIHGTLYGCHTYEVNSKNCKLCGHIKKDFSDHNE